MYTEVHKEENVENFFKQKLSHEVWHDTYKWETDVTVFDTFRRVAKNLASLEKDLKAVLANFKVPKNVVFVDELPKTATGKVLKRKIKEQYSSDS